MKEEEEAAEKVKAEATKEEEKKWQNEKLVVWANRSWLSCDFKLQIIIKL